VWQGVIVNDVVNPPEITAAAAREPALLTLLGMNEVSCVGCGAAIAVILAYHVAKA
jgi:hypothetical protein